MVSNVGTSILLVICLCLGSALARPRSSPKCGYESCPKPKDGMINVHIVSHTHDDVGWLKTLDQYYYGSQTSIQQAGVQYIIDSVVDELMKDPTKKFIYVESAFFFKWWTEQTLEVQEQVKKLVNEGRFEFIGGAWSMNDEASTHYQSVIDQFAWGLRQLNDTFGECGRPRVGWQIDPFGHSREMASMFAQMGFDGMFIGRLDYQDKINRMSTKTPEMIWKASASLGKAAELFTGALFHIYNPPPGFCFDVLCNDEPINDGQYSLDNNVERRINDFFTEVDTIASGYRTNNIVVTMGEDFHYQDANMWFKNLDKLIKYANQKQQNGSNINLFYSTPSCYLKSLYDAEITWPTKEDDFFPYASDPNSFWTGYFTSRPNLKRFEREGNHLVQICKQLTALSKNSDESYISRLDYLREMMGVMQHHDAITGTEKQKVAFDYAKQLYAAMEGCLQNSEEILNEFVQGNQVESKKSDNDMNLEFKTCSFLNISQCEISESADRFILTLYNPLAKTTFENIRVPVMGSNYEVIDFNNEIVESQIVPIPEGVNKLKFRRSTANNELVFLASELPAMGYRSYYITNIHKHRASKRPQVNANKRESDTDEIGNNKLRLSFDSDGFLKSVTSNGVSRLIRQDFAYYEGVVGNNREPNNRSSGAYIFRPKNNTSYPIGSSVNTTFYKGAVVEEVHQSFNEWVSQVIRVYRNENFAEFEWMVGPIPIDDAIGKEIITRFNSDIKSDGEFFTDSNGREMLKRKLNYRETWNLTLEENIAGNYYPLTTKIALEDKEARMAVLIDRAQGGSSFSDGSLEIMVHRRLLSDDAKGVGEALNETAYGEGITARGRHYLFVGPSSKTDAPTLHAQERLAQLQKLLPTWKFFSNASEYPQNQWTQDFTNNFSGISKSLPDNIHLLTYEPWHNNEVLVRFEHIMEVDEDPELSQTAYFTINEVFSNLKIANIRETTLDGSKWLDETQRLTFEADRDTLPESMSASKTSPSVEKPTPRVDVNNLFVQMEPMMIRTFVITLKP